jgi:hypothetical protein
MTVSEQLRAAIERRMRSEPIYGIAKGSGVAWRVIQRFVTGERAELRTGTVDKLCAYLRLELVQQPPAAKPTKRKASGKRTT